MKLFKLPDLGEGLPDAQIREWYVKVGDSIQMDEPMVAMETAKALVDVPAPFTGVVEKLFGAPSDTIHVGQPLIGFEGESQREVVREDEGTVVGKIQTSNTILEENAGLHRHYQHAATPKIRALARKLGVDLNQFHQDTLITETQIKEAANLSKKSSTTPEGMTALSNVRRAMILSMTQSHQSVVPVTISDDADLQAWQGKQDITLRIIRAIQVACLEVPMMNAFFDGPSMSYQLNESIHLGLAVDTPHGLYVPVLKNIAMQTDQALRATINRFKLEAAEKKLSSEDLKGGTLILSNFGSIAGRYANPIILPPMVAIVGVGQLRNQVVAVQDKIEIHKILPLSITTDHRAITGGEMARFLRVLMDELAKPHPPQTL